MSSRNGSHVFSFPLLLLFFFFRFQNNWGHGKVPLWITFKTAYCYSCPVHAFFPSLANRPWFSGHKSEDLTQNAVIMSLMALGTVFSPRHEHTMQDSPIRGLFWMWSNWIRRDVAQLVGPQNCYCLSLQCPLWCCSYPELRKGIITKRTPSQWMRKTGTVKGVFRL